MQLTGTGASPGKTKGIARIIHNHSDLIKLRNSEILIARETDPIFTIAMMRAAAIVTDFGGLSCHAAIVAREFGLPCVVGTEKATELITTGTIVVVDGDKGEVYSVEG